MKSSRSASCQEVSPRPEVAFILMRGGYQVTCLHGRLIKGSLSYPVLSRVLSTLSFTEKNVQDINNGKN